MENQNFQLTLNLYINYNALSNNIHIKTCITQLINLTRSNRCLQLHAYPEQ